MQRGQLGFVLLRERPQPRRTGTGRLQGASWSTPGCSAKSKLKARQRQGQSRPQAGDEAGPGKHLVRFRVCVQPWPPGASAVVCATWAKRRPASLAVAADGDYLSTPGAAVACFQTRLPTHRTGPQTSLEVTLEGCLCLLLPSHAQPEPTPALIAM